MKKTRSLFSVLLAVVLFGLLAVGVCSFEASAVEPDANTTLVVVREADGNDDGSVTDSGVRIFKTIRGATAWADTQSWGETAKLRIEIDQDQLSLTPASTSYVFADKEVGLITRTNYEALPITIASAESRTVTLTITSGGNYYFFNDLRLENMKIISGEKAKWYFANNAEFYNVELTINGSSLITATARVHGAYFLTDGVYRARRDENGDINTTLTFSGNTIVKYANASSSCALYGTYPFDGETTAPKPGTKFPESFAFGDDTLYRHQFNGKVVFRDNAEFDGTIRAKNSTYLGDGIVEIRDNATVKGEMQNVFNRGSYNNSVNRIEIFGGNIHAAINVFKQTTWPIEEGSSVELIIHDGTFEGAISATKGGTVYEGNKGITIYGGTFGKAVAGDVVNIYGGTFASSVSGTNVSLSDGANVTLSGKGNLDVDRVGANVSISHKERFEGFDKIYVKAPKDAVLNAVGVPAPVTVSGENGVELRGGYLPIGASVVMNERIALKVHVDKAMTDLYREKVGTPDFSFSLGGKELGKGYADLVENGDNYVLMLPATGADGFDQPFRYFFGDDLVAVTTIQELSEQGVVLYAKTADEALFKALVDYSLAGNGAKELKYFDPDAINKSVIPEYTAPVLGEGKVEITEISLLMGDSIGIRFKTQSDLNGISVKVNGSVIDPTYYSTANGAIDLYVHAAHLNEILKIEIYDADGVLSASFGYAVSNINLRIYEEEKTNMKAAATLELILAIENKKNAEEPYTPPTDSESIQHPLDGKKFIFIGNSYTYYGKCVLEKSNKIQSQEERSHDKGYFYQIAKENGADIEVTNWTYGNHCLEDTFGGSCGADRGCDGYDHTTDLIDRNYDYVMFQEHSLRSENFEKSVDSIMTLFREANPNVKFFCLVPLRIYEVDSDATRGILKSLKTIEEKGITVVDWGRLVYDVYSGTTAVPGSEMTYNRNSFVISQSESDGHHQNMLGGYITAQMTWCALTGDAAEGQEYRFVGDTSVNSAFDIEAYIQKYYSFGGVTTNFDKVLQSKTEITGFQKLIDKYLAEKAYRNFI